MKRKKILMFLLAINIFITANSEISEKLNKPKFKNIHENFIKNFQFSKSNHNNYKILEEILKTKNKELKDLYSQNDYIVKPEYLEWQIYSNAVYTKKNRGYNTLKNAVYDSDPNYNSNNITGKPNLEEQQAKELVFGINIPIKNISLDPVDINVSIKNVITPTVSSFTFIKPNKPEIPIINIESFTVITPSNVDSVLVNKPVMPVTPNIETKSFIPVKSSFTLPVLNELPQINISSGGGSNTGYTGFYKNGDPNSIAIISQMNIDSGEIYAKINSHTSSRVIYDYYTLNNVTGSPSNGFSLSSGADSLPTGSFNSQTAGPFKPKVQAIFKSINDTVTRIGLYNSIIGNTIITLEGDDPNPLILGQILHFDGHYSGMPFRYNLDLMESNGWIDNTVKQEITDKFLDTASGQTTGNRFFQYVENNATMYLKGSDIVAVNIQAHESNYSITNIFTNRGSIIGLNEASSGNNLIGKQVAFIVTEGGGTAAGNRKKHIGIDNTGLVELRAEESVGYLIANSAVAAGDGKHTLRNSSDFKLYGNGNIGVYTKYTSDDLNSINDLSSLKLHFDSPITILGDQSVGIDIERHINFLDSVMKVDIGTENNKQNEISATGVNGLLNSGNISGNNTDYTENVSGIFVDMSLYDPLNKSFNLNNYIINIGNPLNLDSAVKNSIGVRVKNGNVTLGNNGNSIIELKSSGLTNSENLNNIGGVSENSEAKLTLDTNSIILISGGENNLGLYSKNKGVVINNGNIRMTGGLEHTGIVIDRENGINGIGENSGTILITSDDSTGIYNKGNFSMNSGNIILNGLNNVGIYANGNTAVTKITGGTITVNNSSLAFYSDDSVINIDGSGFIINGGVLFYRNEDKGSLIVDNSAEAFINNNGSAFYIKGGTDASLHGLISGANSLKLNMSPGSTVLVWDTPSSQINISDVKTILGGTLDNVVYTGNSYNNSIINKADLVIDEDVILEGSGNKYISESNFLSSKVTLNNNKNISGSLTEQYGIIQRNFENGNQNDILLTNNGNITLSGTKSIGIASDYGIINNNNKIKTSGDYSIGIFSTNGSDTANNGEITADGDNTVAMYGKNYFNSSIPIYGNGKINITNNGTINLTNNLGKRYGIYLDNSSGIRADSILNLTKNSVIDFSELKDGGIGVYLLNSTLNDISPNKNLGEIKINSNGTGKEGIGIYADNSSAVIGKNGSDIGKLTLTGTKGVAVYLSAGSKVINNGKIDISGEKNIGFYTRDSNTLAQNYGKITISNGSIGMYSTLSGIIDNLNSEIISNGIDSVGMYIDTNSFGNNKADITINGNNSVGIYNLGTFTMTNGNIKMNSTYGTAIYAKDNNSTGLSGGNIQVNNGSIALYSNNSEINLSGNIKMSIGNSSLLLYTSNNGLINTGKINLNGQIIVDINSKGTAFDIKNNTSLESYLNDVILGTTAADELVLNMNSSDSRLFIINDTSGSQILLSSLSLSSPLSGQIGTTRVKISNSSVSNYKLTAVNHGNLLIDLPVNLDDPSDTYVRSEFLSSKVTLGNGGKITGTKADQLAIGQKNYNDGTLTGTLGNIDINIESGREIELSGQNSTAIAVDYGVVNNKGEIKIKGEKSLGIFSANGSVINNNGLISLGDNTVGIYGTSYFDGITSASILGYGTDRIDITNNGIIKSNGILKSSIGIYSENITGLISNSNVKTNSGSLIDISSSENSIGIYLDTTKLLNKGNLEVGSKGIGIYGKNSEIIIDEGTINLYGDSSLGFYLDENTKFTGNSLATINISGKNVALFNIGDNATIINNMTINVSAGSTYVIGTLKDKLFYTNNDTTLKTGGTFLYGLNSAVLLDSNSKISSSDKNTVGLFMDSKYSGSYPVTIGSDLVYEEGTNKGIIELGNESIGIYGINGATFNNSGNITVGSDSTGIHAAGLNSHIKNSGEIKIFDNSQGLYLEDGNYIIQVGKISSTKISGVGLFAKSNINTQNIINNGEIKLLGDNSIGIYSLGTSQKQIENNGNIIIGNSLNKKNPSVGIYTSNIHDNILNNVSSSIILGKNSIGIYSSGNLLEQKGYLEIGESGVGIYKDKGVVNISSSANIKTGDNSSIGINALNGAQINIFSGSIINIGKNSFGIVLESGASLSNSSDINLDEDGIFVYSTGNGTVLNNGSIKMAGSNNTGFYLKNNKNLINTGDIISNTGSGNIGIYTNGGNLINTGNINIDNTEFKYDSLGALDIKKSLYAVGVYAENSNVVNGTAGMPGLNGNINLGEGAIGVYVKGNTSVFQNYGNITSKISSDNAIGLYAEDGEGLINYGNINLDGKNVIGITGKNVTKIINEGNITVTGDGAIGIYGTLGTEVENRGTITIGGDNSIGIIASNGKITNFGGKHGGTIIFLGGLNQKTLGSNKDYEIPELINAGLIIVDGHFENKGMNISIKTDPSTINWINTPAGFEFVINSTNIKAETMTITDTIKILSDFTQGTNADTYKLENVFTSSNINLPTGNLSMISDSFTWEATPKINSETGHIDVYMSRRSYGDLTKGLWYEDAALAFDEAYAFSSGKAGKIYDKIDLLKTEKEFRHIMAGLSGNVYSNINQREENITELFENSLYLLKNSKNNTKENIKIDIIAGKGDTKEDTDGVTGYNYKTSGILGLREVERTYKHTFGYSLGYLHTNFNFDDKNESKEKTDTLQLGVHNKYLTNNWKIISDITGRISFHNMDRNIKWPNPSETSRIKGKYEVYSITNDNIIGKELLLGKYINLMPYGALRTTYITRPGFSENGLESLKIKENDVWSIKPRAGLELEGILPLGSKKEWQLKSIIDLSYEYELADINKREYAKLTVIEKDYHKLAKPQDEKGKFRTKIALGVELENKYGIFLTGDYAIENNNQSSYKTGVALKIVF